MYQSEYNFRILCEGARSNQIDRLSILLQQFAQAESLSVRISVNQPPHVTLQCGDRTYQCPRDNLRDLVSDGHYCICHLTTGSSRLRISFADAAAQLLGAEPDTYLVVNRGILVNRHHITGHTDDAILLDDGTTYAVRRADRYRLFQEFDTGHK